VTEAFFTLHRDLLREGPGEPADVAWAAGVAGLIPTARIADLGCGAGADIAALLAAAPEGQVTAIEQVPCFVDAAAARFVDDARVTVRQGDMASPGGPYDFIWCAGAAYFLGITEALTAWRGSLAPGGAVAFSEICWFTDSRPDEAARFWREYPAMTDEAGVAYRVRQAGFEVLASRRLSDAAWEAYFTPLDARIAALRLGADAALAQVLDEAEEEARIWRTHRDAFGYLLSVVRPA
jgi:trans-aconitate methyltransferase